MPKRITYLFVTAMLAKSFCAQVFLNGSFETNSAGAFDQINLTNAAYNAMMANSVAFGTFGDMDIIRTATWGGSGAQNGLWYVALTGSGTDAFSMQLGAALTAGTTYTISFYDRADGGFVPMPVQIGVSTVSGAFGTAVYTAPTPLTNVWTNRVFSFTAPVSGQYITVQLMGGALSNWSHVDNFSFVSNLPIELVKFDAKCSDNQTVLQWSTASEKMNKGFTIERSEDGENFSPIGNVDGAGNSDVERVYSFVDANHSGSTVYYRLIQFDNNGSSSISKIISANNCGISGKNAYQINYNSINDMLEIAPQQGADHYEISVMNELGQTLIRKNVETPENSISTSGLTAGAYLVRIIGREGVFVKKIVKN